jgi:hypothetical protein
MTSNINGNGYLTHPKNNPLTVQTQSSQSHITQQRPISLTSQLQSYVLNSCSQPRARFQLVLPAVNMGNRI